MSSSSNPYTTCVYTRASPTTPRDEAGKSKDTGDAGGRWEHGALRRVMGARKWNSLLRVEGLRVGGEAGCVGEWVSAGWRMGVVARRGGGVARADETSEDDGASIDPASATSGRGAAHEHVYVALSLAVTPS